MTELKHEVSYLFRRGKKKATHLAGESISAFKKKGGVHSSFYIWYVDEFEA